MKTAEITRSKQAATGIKPPSTWVVFANIYKKEGLAGINKGVNAVAVRQATNWGSRYVCRLFLFIVFFFWLGCYSLCVWGSPRPSLFRLCAGAPAPVCDAVQSMARAFRFVRARPVAHARTTRQSNRRPEARPLIHTLIDSHMSSILRFKSPRSRSIQFGSVHF